MTTNNTDELLDTIKELVAEREAMSQKIADLDDKITDLLVQARTEYPPVPLTALAEATHITVSGVSIRVARAHRKS